MLKWAIENNCPFDTAKIKHEINQGIGYFEYTEAEPDHKWIAAVTKVLEWLAER